MKTYDSRISLESVLLDSHTFVEFYLWACNQASKSLTEIIGKDNNFKQLCDQATAGNLKVILKDFTESPIEKIFLHSFCIACLKNYKIPVLFHRKPPDTFPSEANVLAPLFCSVETQHSECIEGITMRADMLINCPGFPKSFWIECDGYDYHSDPSKFTSDRSRDRLLSSAGFQVRRYSGSEIKRSHDKLTMELAAEVFHFQDGGES